MAISSTRQQFKDRCLRRLGFPAVEINVTEEQVDDCVDDALQYWWDYHSDGTEKQYYKHQVTEQDVANKYITIPENIIGVINIFTIGDALNTNNLFNIRYQIALSDLYTLTNISIVPYFMALQHIRVLEQMLVGQQPIRYNRHRDKVHIDMDWEKIEVGKYIILECYEVIDPDTYIDAWNDRWLLQYCTALIKRQWGYNTKKYSGMMMPGGVQYNGQKYYDEAVEEIRLLEQDMIRSYSIPASDMIGAIVLTLMSYPLISKMLEIGVNVVS